MCLIKYQLIDGPIINCPIIDKNDFSKVIYLEFNTNINNIFMYYPHIAKMTNVRKIICAKSIGKFNLPIQLANLIRLSELCVYDSYDIFSSPNRYDWININNLYLDKKIILSPTFDIDKNFDLYSKIEYMTIIGINDMSINWCKRNLVNLPENLQYLHMPINSSVLENIDFLSNLPPSLKELSLAIFLQETKKDFEYIENIINKLKIPFDCKCTYFCV
jgi:hypothetical protein